MRRIMLLLVCLLSASLSAQHVIGLWCWEMYTHR
jgi:hypothetical protein